LHWIAPCGAGLDGALMALTANAACPIEQCRYLVSAGGTTMNNQQNVALAQFVKSLVAGCVRNNSSLEDIHAGSFPRTRTGDYSDVKVVTPYCEIPWTQLSRISDEEMKRLMIEIVDNVFTVLSNTILSHSPTEAENLALTCFSLNSARSWNNPRLDPRFAAILQAAKTHGEKS
jgi:hypothetical protein